MSNAARKARKRNGIKFERKPKVGTPLEQRALRPKDPQHLGLGLFSTTYSNRHQRKINNAILIREKDRVATTKTETADYFPVQTVSMPVKPAV